MLTEVDQKIRHIAQQYLPITSSTTNTPVETNTLPQPLAPKKKIHEPAELVTRLTSLPLELFAKHVEQLPFNHLEPLCTALTLLHNHNCQDTNNHRKCPRSDYMKELKRIYQFCSEPQFEFSVRNLFTDPNASDYQKRLCSAPLSDLSYQELKAIEHDMNFMVKTGGVGDLDPVTGKMFSPLTDEQLFDVFDYAFKTKNLPWMEQLCKGSSRLLDLFKDEGPGDHPITEKIKTSYFFNTAFKHLEILNEMNSDTVSLEKKLSSLRNHYIKAPSITAEDHEFYKNMLKLFISNDCFHTTSFGWNSTLLLYASLVNDIELTKPVIERLDPQNQAFSLFLSICAQSALMLNNIAVSTYLLENHLNMIEEGFFFILCLAAIFIQSDDIIKNMLMSHPHFNAMVADKLDSLILISLKAFCELGECKALLDKLLDHPDLTSSIELCVKTLDKQDSPEYLQLFLSKILDLENPQRFAQLSSCARSSIFYTTLRHGWTNLLDRALTLLPDEELENPLRGRLAICKGFLNLKTFTDFPEYTASAEVFIQHIMETDQFSDTIGYAAHYNCIQAMETLLQDNRCESIGDETFLKLIKWTKSEEIKKALRAHPSCPKKMNSHTVGLKAPKDLR